MKKILCLLVLLLSLTATCAAFNPPQPPRWFWVGSGAHYGAWIDTATARFYTGSEKYAHRNHQCALVWVEWYDADKDEYEISHDEYDFDCRLMRTLSATFYNSQNRVIDLYNRSYADFEDIIPGTNGEMVYDAVALLKETRENARRL
ncbi:hypothetical protein [Phascolarctobacterium succinatutens]